MPQQPSTPKSRLRWTLPALSTGVLLAPSTALAATPSDPIVLAGAAALVMGLGVAGLMAGMRAWRARKPVEPAGRSAEATPPVAAPPAPLRTGPVRVAAKVGTVARDPVDVVALAETVVMDALAAGRRPAGSDDVEVGWLVRLDRTSFVELELAPIRAMLDAAMADALSRTVRGCVNLHLEWEDDQTLRFEVEDSTEEPLTAVPTAVADAAARAGVGVSVHGEPGVGSILCMLAPVRPLPAAPASSQAATVEVPEGVRTIGVEAADPLALATAEGQLGRLGVALQSGAGPCELQLRGPRLWRGETPVGTLPMRTSAWQRHLVAPPSGPLRVLVVDDNEGNAFITERMFSRRGAEVTRASNGQAALDAYRAAHFDLVLMDCEMPGWDGVRATAEIRRCEVESGRPLAPVLLTTAHSRDRVWPRFSAVGASDALRMPLTADSVDAALRTWVGVKATLGPAEPLEVSITEAPEGPPQLAHLNPELFTLEALDELLTLGDMEFAHLAQVWCHSVKHLRRELELGLQQRDGNRVRTAAHTLKSSTASMGLFGLQKVFLQVERLAEMGALGAASSVLIQPLLDLDAAVEQLASAASACVSSGKSTAEESGPAGGFRVLVVDDDPYVRSVVSRTLAQDGCSVEAVASGEAALRRLSEQPPELVLMDVQMPGMDGFTACRRLREEPTLAELPVVIMTGQDDLESVQRAFDVGATDFISKPFQPQLLLHRLRFLRRAQLNMEELRENRERIKVLAYCDRVTGLPNRVRLLDALGAAHAECADDAEAPGLAVVFIDLDRFKQVNDTLGHAVGDDLLRAVGRRLQVTLDSCTAGRPELQEHLLARFGGDEFVVLLRGVSTREEASKVTLPLVEAARRPFKLGPHLVQIGASAGIALFPEDGETVDALITTADSAMYRVKKVGGNGLRAVAPDDDTMDGGANPLLAELREAIRTDALEVYLQPRISGDLERVAGAEALVRWRHPKRGLLLPGSFIQLAEENDLIGAIGKVVLRRSLEIVANLDEQGYDLPRISVNVSALQLREPDFADTVLQCIRESGVSPRRVELEVTETAVIDNFNLAVQSLDRLRARGVSIAIDDFGTGHASLHYLHRLPVDCLKIDRSFVELLSNSDPADQGGPSAVVTMLLALGQAMGLCVVAEGVETQTQLARLCRLGCDEYQGFLLSRPLPVSAFKEYLARRGRSVA